jgi:hypothetical protein
MRVLLPLLAGGGLALLVSGLPPLRGGPLARRVEPYLRGLHLRGGDHPKNARKTPRCGGQTPSGRGDAG